MAIQNSTIGTTPAAFYTSAGDTAVTCIYFCNTSSNPVTFSVYAVPSGALAIASTRIYSTVTLTANDTYVVDMEKLILSSGDSLQAEADQEDVITVTVSSVGI